MHLANDENIFEKSGWGQALIDDHFAQSLCNYVNACSEDGLNIYGVSDGDDGI